MHEAEVVETQKFNIVFYGPKDFMVVIDDRTLRNAQSEVLTEFGREEEARFAGNLLRQAGQLFFEFDLAQAVFRKSTALEMQALKGLMSSLNRRFQEANIPFTISYERPEGTRGFYKLNLTQV
jgi:hypothetical protein